MNKLLGRYYLFRFYLADALIEIGENEKKLNGKTNFNLGELYKDKVFYSGKINLKSLPKLNKLETIK